MIHFISILSFGFSVLTVNLSFAQTCSYDTVSAAFLYEYSFPYDLFSHHDVLLRKPVFICDSSKNYYNKIFILPDQLNISKKIRGENSIPVWDSTSINNLWTMITLLLQDSVPSSKVKVIDGLSFLKIRMSIQICKLSRYRILIPNFKYYEGSKRYHKRRRPVYLITKVLGIDW